MILPCAFANLSQYNLIFSIATSRFRCVSCEILIELLIFRCISCDFFLFLYCGRSLFLNLLICSRRMFQQKSEWDRTYLFKRLPYQQLNNVNYKTYVRNVNCTWHEIATVDTSYDTNRIQNLIFAVENKSIQFHFLCFIIRIDQNDDHVKSLTCHFVQMFASAQR